MVSEVSLAIEILKQRDDAGPKFALSLSNSIKSLKVSAGRGGGPRSGRKRRAVTAHLLMGQLTRTKERLFCDRRTDASMAACYDCVRRALPALGSSAGFS